MRPGNVSRVWQRLSRAVMAAFLLTGCAGGGGLVTLSPVSAPPPSTPAAVTPSLSPSAGPSVPEHGNGTFSSIAGGGTAIEGMAGTLVTYCVLLEDGITTFTADGFAAAVDMVLADPRSWIAARRWRFQRLPTCAIVDLRVHLATPDTTDRRCYPAADTEGRYSCRHGDNIFINLRRWTLGVPHFGDDLATYRRMVVNHEVGHYLGFSHVPCPGPGRLAPVMQTQTIAMHGCVINPYPYPDGVDYVG